MFVAFDLNLCVFGCSFCGNRCKFAIELPFICFHWLPFYSCVKIVDNDIEGKLSQNEQLVRQLQLPKMESVVCLYIFKKCRLLQSPLSLSQHEVFRL